MLGGERHGWRWAAALAIAATAARLYATRRYFKETPGPVAFLHDDVRTAWTPAWRELLTGVQWLRLRRSPVYRGEGVPHGHHEPVLLVHGFLTRGLYLEPLRAWLHGLGYRARVADIGRNADCLDVLARRLTEDVETLHRQTGMRVHLVGHSLGGMLARAVAARAPHLVASVATLATPLRGLRVHPGVRLTNIAVRRLVRLRRRASVFEGCLTLACECATVRALTAPLPSTVPQLAVTAPGDGILDWRYAADRVTMQVVEVPGSHTGMVFEVTVYEALARHLAAARTASALTVRASREP